MAKKETTQKLWRFLLILYGSIMLWLLFGRSSLGAEGLSYHQQLLRNTNFKPFYTIGNYVRVLINSRNQQLLRESIINLGGNIFLFIPAGLLFPRVWSFLRKFFPYIAFCTGVILLVEILQLFTLLGCFDVDDLILNLFGMCIGFMLYKITDRG